MYKTLERYLIAEESFGSDVKIESFNTDDGEGFKHIFYDNGIEIGHACVCTYEKKNDFLFNVEVKKSLRGKGYGTKIVKYMIDKYHVRHLIVGKNNTVAQNLYKKFKFKYNGDVEGSPNHIRMKRG